ncbi:Survival motor neuron-like protein 1 [Cytospora mali]|uniref:Survival motor neuron-like protein 1 n=1 Tax=Cytospora mali TaxID=578113 RepID=A0A194V9P7_CYTMA|nr:Survival motor neuron-like protein 1 [Valsa mali var. pyri (nom. inval.)]
MGQEGNEMTHDDIWDDSALVSSWNEALDEYKKYHSIHASGGKLEDLPEYRQDANAKPEPDLPSAAPAPERSSAIGSNHAQPETTSVVGAEGTDGAAKSGNDEGVVNSDRNAGLGQGLNGGGPMPPPQALLGSKSSVQDEGLKRLLMSWYYAGYYTGLYEGQQRQS